MQVAMTRALKFVKILKRGCFWSTKNHVLARNRGVILLRNSRKGGVYGFQEHKWCQHLGRVGGLGFSADNKEIHMSLK